MTRINPVHTEVVSSVTRGDRVAIKCKSDRVAYTVDVAKDSPFVGLAVKGAKITFTLDVETPREAPGEADQFTTTQMVQPPVMPSELLEESRRDLEVQTGLKTVQLADNPQIRDMLGLPDYSKSEAPKVGLMEPVNVVEN